MERAALTSATVELSVMYLKSKMNIFHYINNSASHIDSVTVAIFDEAEIYNVNLNGLKVQSISCIIIIKFIQFFNFFLFRYVPSNVTKWDLSKRNFQTVMI